MAIQRYCYCLFLMVADMLTTSPSTGNHVDSPKGQVGGLNCHPAPFSTLTPYKAYTPPHYIYPGTSQPGICLQVSGTSPPNRAYQFACKQPPTKALQAIQSDHSHTSRPLRGSAAAPAPSIWHNGASATNAGIPFGFSSFRYHLAGTNARCP